jgi:hypothetical protein
VLAALRYELVLTGPRGELLERTVTGGESFSLAVNLGEWRIDTKAYQDTVLAGTGSVTLAVGPGRNSAQVPMNMSGKCYEITIDSTVAHGTVRSNFTAAFAGTAITITAEEDPGATFVDNSLEAEESGTANPVVLSGSGTSRSFTMPAADVTVYAEFVKGVRYVREGGSGDGTSWNKASGDLQKMMDELWVQYTDYPNYPYTVKVGAGTYKPQHMPEIPASPGSYTAGGSDAAFILREGVQVWGGYPAGGGDSRNVTANETILSGDINDSNTVNSGDAYHVVLAVDLPPTSGTVLDGLTIKGGNADGFGSNPLVGSATVYSGSGGGMYNFNANPVLINVTISGNRANGGGGMYNGDSSPVLVNVKISGNDAGGGGGGGIYNTGSSSRPVLINTLISGNKASDGGGIENNGSSPVLINVTIAGNSAYSGGGGMYSYGSNPLPKIYNSIIWGNTGGGSPGIYGTVDSITDSSVEGFGGSDPLFSGPEPASSAPTTGGDYRLNSGSPAIGQGLNASYPADATDSIFPAGLSDEAKAAINAALSQDLGGNIRIQGGSIDMGAYERQ